MRVYIPFNSNDFNSVFTTLSISPCSFYPNRKYSFKRATTTYLNENEDFLVGYEKPIFHNREFDKDYGFPVLIEIEVESAENEWQTTQNGLKYIIIDNTVFLLGNFKLLFRSEKELNETFAKSLKSIETKFATLAKQNSEVVKKDCFDSEIPSIQFPPVNNNLNSLTFYKERKLNRMLGAILGSSIAHTNLKSKEWQEISILLRFLNNNLSLFLNKISDNNEFEKKQVLEIIDKILKTYETVEKLEEAIMLGANSSFTSELLNNLKQSTIFGLSAFNLLIEGLLTSSKAELPLSLKLEKLKRAINSKFNSKYPSNYIQRVNNAFSDVRFKIENEINLLRKNNKLAFDSLVRPHYVNDKLELIIPEGLLENEKKYLLECLKFFIETDNIPDLETFFTNRKTILIDLAKHLKDTIDNFNGSKEREYLGELLRSFDSLRGGFDISRTSNEVLKSIAILFTSGRDLLKFIENNEREEIQNSLIYYTLWGSIYGAAILPKTLTEPITEDKSNVKTLISAYSETIREYQNNKTESHKNIESTIITTEPVKKVKVQEDLKDTSIIELNTVNEPIEKYTPPISRLGSQILEQVEMKKKMKLADLKSLSKSFKTNRDVENLINNQLKDRIKITKKGSTMYAELIDNGQLKFD
ncbi:MAG: hypothetical protein QW818_03815 [Candidatus Aenigmatarchaeota archaeon]